jgi:DNA invertase Pin-like site-specific DNA recombinase
MQHAEQGEFNVVVVHAIDRFYRDLSGLLAALHHLHQHHVTFVSITENLDFTAHAKGSGTAAFLLATAMACAPRVLT